MHKSKKYLFLKIIFKKKCKTLSVYKLCTNQKMCNNISYMSGSVHISSKSPVSSWLLTTEKQKQILFIMTLTERIQRFSLCFLQPPGYVSIFPQPLMLTLNDLSSYWRLYTICFHWERDVIVFYHAVNMSMHHLLSQWQPGLCNRGWVTGSRR